MPVETTKTQAARLFFTSFYEKPWAVTLPVFDEMEEKMGWVIDSTHSTTHEMYLEAIKTMPKTAFGVDGDGGFLLPPEPGKVAVVSISGILEERLSFWGWLFGGVSTSMIQDVLTALINDETVETIILDINSPGGEIGGIANLAETIYKGREKKQIISVIGTMGASGGYWIAAAAEKVYISAPTSQAGSIGVVIAHRDISEAEKKRGVKTTEITAGRFKRVVSSHRQLDNEGQQELRTQANKFYQPFLSAISKYRDIPIGEMDTRAEGRIFIGQDIIDIGLGDEFSTLPDVLERVTKPKENTMADQVNNVAAPTSPVEPTVVLEQITAETLQNKYPAVYNEVFNSGAKAERERIQSIEAVALPGFETIVNPVKFDGKTTGPEVAAKIVAEQKQNRGYTLPALAGDSTQASYSTPQETDENKEIEALASGIVGATNPK